MKDFAIFAGKVLLVLVIYKIAKSAVATALPASIVQFLP